MFSFKRNGLWRQTLLYLNSSVPLHVFLIPTKPQLSHYLNENKMPYKVGYNQ